MKRKSFYIFTLFIVQSILIFPQGTWENIISPTNQFLTSVHFADSLYGWAVGDSGVIIHTTDGGTQWQLQISNTTDKITDVFFINRNIGWAAAWNVYDFPFGTVLHKTTDGGQSWISAPYREEGIFIRCILFLDSLTGWMGGTPHALVKTTDGGTIWKQADIDSTVLAFFPVHNIKFYNEFYGYACGGAFEVAGVIWKTTNGGKQWVALEPTFAPPDPVHQIHLFDELNVMGVGGDFEFNGVGIVRTSDGGNFWDYESIGLAGVAFDLEFRNDNEAWITRGFPGSFIFSSDSGTTWKQTPVNADATILEIFFLDSLHGFAVGKNGTILKYKPPIINNISTESRLILKEYVLLQNYPNPFNPGTVIKYSIPQDGFVTLDVFNSLGEKVASLVYGMKVAGNYEINFNASDLASGIYFYKLQAGSFIETKKMILIK